MAMAIRTLRSSGVDWNGAMIAPWRTLILAALLAGGLVGLAAANPMGQSENFRDRPGGDYFSYRASQGAGEFQNFAKSVMSLPWTLKSPAMYFRCRIGGSATSIFI